MGLYSECFTQKARIKAPTQRVSRVAQPLLYGKFEKSQDVEWLNHAHSKSA